MKPNACEHCARLLEHNKSIDNAHQFLLLLSSGTVKRIGQPKHFFAEYQCSQCNNRLRFEDDKNDPVHWNLMNIIE